MLYLFLPSGGYLESKFETHRVISKFRLRILPVFNIGLILLLLRWGSHPSCGCPGTCVIHFESYFAQNDVSESIGQLCNSFRHTHTVTTDQMCLIYVHLRVNFRFKTRYYLLWIRLRKGYWSNVWFYPLSNCCILITSWCC